MWDWARLFDSIGIEHRERGRNTSRNNINICCPLCGADDDGFHLRIAMESGVFYCLRRPRQHSGRSPLALLGALGYAHRDATALLSEYRADPQASRQAAEPARPAGEIAATWERLLPLDDEALDYLRARGFPDPAAVASRYDLRCTPQGRWAGRILFPIRDEAGTVVAWTGRSIRDDLEPRYQTQHGGLQGLIYQPRPARDVMMLVEGPIDALKVAVVSEAMPISATALLGTGYNTERLARLRSLSAGCRTHWVCLDASTSPADGMQLAAELRVALLQSDPVPAIIRVRLPRGLKDAGAMEMEDCERWLMELREGSGRRSL